MHANAISRDAALKKLAVHDGSPSDALQQHSCRAALPSMTQKQAAVLNSTHVHPGAADVVAGAVLPKSTRQGPLALPAC